MIPPPLMTLNDAIDNFLSYLYSERNLAPQTIEAYSYDLHRLAEYLSDGKEDVVSQVEDVDAWALKDYVAALKEEHDLKPTSLSRHISSIRSFFKFLLLREFIETNPALRLHMPKKAKRLPVFLSPVEVQSLLNHSLPEELMDARNHTMLVLFVMTGIRLSELVNLDTGDLDFENGTIKVMGKGRKERLAPMNASSSKALNEWLEKRPRGHMDCPALFMDRHGNRVTKRMVQYSLEKAVKSLGLDPRISPHKLRHTFATTLYAEDVDLRDIQELLGHSSITSTSVYTHTNVKKIRDAVNLLDLE